MKILYIYKYAILGGVTTQLVNRLKYLKGKVDAHFLFIQDHGGTKAFNGYEKVLIENNTTKIAQYIDENKFDFVISIDTMESYEAIKKAKHKSIVISEVHTTTRNLYNLKLLKKDLPMNAFITPSSYLKDKIYNELGFKGLRECYVVENCLDLDKFALEKVSYKHDKRIIGWIGKLDEHKNWRKFIRICSILNDKLKNLEFWIIGGYTAPQYVINEFLDLINKYNLFDKVKWFSYIPYNKMPRIFNIIRESGGLYTSTSRDESFGMTAVEAMACKCPILMPNVGALKEVLDGKLKDHYLYDESDDQQYINKINDLLKNNDTLLDYGYKRVNERYRVDIIGEKYIKTLKKIENELVK
ncbi:glycosyltransferase family 4 protein [Caminicella sporogenes]|uniref:glycosyltransferase family 4 protein n=1 Tax=Caminicella sporogenes TaxID=166485 RepID=UPI002541CC1E|nr:glycosyltransferase family 4 protein [Caminicella sporogenes]WIF96093.1 glycosyltransferase family 4 protein [Caminicella sporogenes]